MPRFHSFLSFCLGALLLASLGCGGGGGATPGAGGGASAPPVGEEVRGRTLGNGWAAMERSLAAGRWMVFHTTQALVAEDANATYDVYLRDLETGTVTLISRTGAGIGNRASYYASISSDGNRIAYASDATNLVADDTNSRRDIFLHDRAAGTTERLSLTSTGAQGPGTSTFPTINAEGTLVAFVSDGKLVPQKTTTAVDVFLRDLAGATTTLLTPGLAGTGGNGASSAVVMSGDGRYLTFVSAATNLVTGDTNGAADVFVLDRQTSTLERVSLGTGGVQANGACANPTLSDDGRYVAWDSTANNLMAGDTNLKRDVFLRDRVAGTTLGVSLSAEGALANGDSSMPTLSRDGALLAFGSLASNLVPNDTNAASDVFWLPRANPAGIARGSQLADGTAGSGASDQAVWDSGSANLVFRTAAANLAAGASTTAPVLTSVQLTPDAPSGLAGTAGDGTATLTWAAAAGADSYEVLRDGAVVATTTGLTVTLTGLVNGETYSYTVRARNEAGVSAATEPLQVSLPLLVPGAPTGVEVVGGNASAIVIWAEVSGADSYQVLVNGTPTVTTTETAAAITGLTNGLTYSFAVKAVNEHGPSAPSETVTAATTSSPGVGLPAAPTGLSGGATYTEVSLSWDEVVGADVYHVYVNGSATPSATTVDPSAVVGGLGSGYTYNFTVKARNAAGLGPASSSLAKTLPIPTPPAAPTGLQAVSGNASVTLLWNDTFGATSYEVYVNGSATPSATPTAASANVTGLANGQTYSFTVKAKNAVGLSPASGAVTGTPQAPPPELLVPAAPTNVVATAGDAQATLTWTASSGATSYEVYLQGGASPVKTVTATSTTITALTNGNTYTYVVRARNAAGLSDASLPATVALTVPGTTAWAKVGGSAGSEICYDVATGPDGTLYLTGYFAGTMTLGSTTLTASGQDAFVAAVNPTTGAVNWAVRGGGTSTDRAHRVVATANGVYVTGMYLGTPTGFLSGAGASTSTSYYNPFVAALNPSTGAALWAKRAGNGSASDYGWGIAANSSYVFATGYYTGTPTGFLSGLSASAGGNDAYVAALDRTTGATVWKVRTGSTSTDRGYALAATETAVYAVGTVNVGTQTGFASTAGNSVGGYDAYVAALNATNGSTLWAKRTGATSTDQAWAVDVTSNAVYVGGYYNTGTMTGFAPVAATAGGYDTFVAALNLGTGATLWSTRSGGSSTDYIYDLAASSNRVYVTGAFASTSMTGYLSAAGSTAGSYDVVAASLDASNGAAVWAKRTGNVNAAYGRGTAVSSAGAFFTGYFTGTLTGFAANSMTLPGGADFFFARLLP